MGYDSLVENSDTVNELLARYGVKFGIFKNGTFKEQLFPFDPIPREIGAEEFEYLEKGLSRLFKRITIIEIGIEVFLISMKWIGRFMVFPSQIIRLLKIFRICLQQQKK